MAFTKKRIISAIILTLTLFSACGKADDEYENYSFGANISVSESYAFRDDDGRLYVWDIKNNSYEVFCAQPDCKHQTVSENPNTKCSAVVPNAGYFCDYAFIYGEKMYWICTGELNEFLIYESETDGTDKKLVFTADVSLYSGVFPKLLDGKLFFIGSKFDTDNIQNINITEHYSLCSINMSDLSFDDYEEIGSANETMIGAESLYFYKNRIYFQRAEYDENTLSCCIEYFDIDASERKTVLESDENLNIWQYDNGKMYYVVSDNTETYSCVYSYDLDEETSEILMERECYVSNIYVGSDKIFYMSESESGRGIGVCDTSGDPDPAIYLSDDEYVYILGHTSSGHMIHYQDTEHDSFGILSDESFWGLKFAETEFEFEFER